MKKLIAVWGILLCALTTNAFTSPVSAVSTPSAEPDTQATVASESAAAYTLPHVGMLPDNPLYKLKTLRDKIMLFLIRNPENRAEKHLQLADKQLFESLKLAEKDNMSLAIHNAFKGEHHVTLAVNLLKDNTSGENSLPENLVKKLHAATVMHQDLLNGILSRTKTDDDKKNVETILEFSTRNDQQLTDLERSATQSAVLEEPGL